MDRSDFEVEVASIARAVEVEAAWDLLSANAVEPNPFYERWMLPHAVDALDIGGDSRITLIWYRTASSSKDNRVLVGLFPFTITRPWGGLPFSSVENLLHIYCFCGVPLLHREYADLVLETYLDWIRAGTSVPKLGHFRLIPADGDFHHLLVDTIRARKLVSSVEERYTRAIYRQLRNSAEYIKKRFSGRTLKKLHRQKELLSESGSLEFRTLAPDGDLKDWLHAFLELEAAGWKGTGGTALKSSAKHEEFFRKVAQAAHESGRLRFCGLWLNGRAIAMRVAFRAQEGGYLFKIAFDESYAKYSPGTLLEFELIRERAGTEEEWEDSCTAPSNTMYKRLWLHRRAMEDIAFSPGSVFGDLTIALVPLLRTIKARILRPSRKGDAAIATEGES